MIRLADTSEVGRASVEEYEMNPLGSDSYYCKRIHQSESRVIKKRNKSIVHSHKCQFQLWPAAAKPNPALEN